MRGDHRPEAVTDETGTIDPERIHDRQRVTSLVGRSIAVRRDVGTAMASQIEGGHAKRSAEDDHCFAEEPDGQVAGYAVDQDDVGAFSGLLVVKADSIGSDLRHG